MNSLYDPNDDRVVQTVVKYAIREGVADPSLMEHIDRVYVFDSDLWNDGLAIICVLGGNDKLYLSLRIKDIVNNAILDLLTKE